MSPGASELPPLGVSDVIELLSKSANARDSILVGGQAANFWAEHYGVRYQGVMLSKDVDFFGVTTSCNRGRNRVGC